MPYSLPMQMNRNSDFSSSSHDQQNAALNGHFKGVTAEKAALVGGSPAYPAAAVKQSHSRVMRGGEVGAGAAVNHGQ